MEKIKSKISTNVVNKKLGDKNHEHPLQPVEYGHPVTVRDSDVPRGLTTENVAVIEASGTRFDNLSGNDFPISDWRFAFDIVKERYGDCYDFVVFFTDPDLPRIPYSGYHRGIYNEVEGINRSASNSRSQWNTERLQSQIWMGRFSLGTLLQEIGHRWGAFVRYRTSANGSNQNDLLLSGGAHWALEFDDGNSPMDYDELRHVQQSGTSWLREPIGGFEFQFCNLDLYLMGLFGEKEVGKFNLIRNYTEGPPLPGGRRLITGNSENLTIQNIKWAEGKRIPNKDQSQKKFKTAFVVITRNEAKLDTLFLRKVELLRQQLESHFSLATKRRACMDTSLCCGNTVSNRGVVEMKLKKDKIVWSDEIFHGLGPIPVKVELGLETSIGGKPIISWSREESPDIKTGIQHLSAQVKHHPYDGKFRIVTQLKGSSKKLKFHWWASSIS
jgi:hypothetical protein